MEPGHLQQVAKNYAKVKKRLRMSLRWPVEVHLRPCMRLALGRRHHDPQARSLSDPSPKVAND